jgi:hypothetical protein
MKKLFVLSIVTLVILACGVPALGPSAQPTSAPNSGAPSGSNASDMATFVALTVQAQQPAATQAPAATAVSQPTAASGSSQTGQGTSAGLKVNQNWGGTFLWHDGHQYPVTLAISKVSDTSFTGAMVWSFSTCRVTERVQGDIYQDVTSAPEQSRWALHPDFKSGDKSGPWFRWTQTESIGSGACYLTITGDWWYGHIGGDGHLTGIHFENSTDAQPDKNVVFDFSLPSQ